MDKLTGFKTNLKRLVSSLKTSLETGKISPNEFLDNIDKFINKNSFVFEYFFTLISSEFPKGVNVIVSGEFGRIFLNKFHQEKKINIVLLESLRNNKGLIKIISGRINDSIPSVFLDDSYFSGFTYSSINSNFVRLIKVYICFFIPSENNRENLPKNIFSILDYFKEFSDEDLIEKNIFLPKKK